MTQSSYEPYVPGRPAPEDRAPAVRASAGCARKRDDGPDLGFFLLPTVICTAIWLMTGGGYFWPMWVMLGTGIPVVLGGLARLDRRTKAHRGHCPNCGH